MRWYAPLLFLTAGILLALVPTLKQIFGFPAFYLLFLYFIFFWVAQASSWNMLTGYSGYFSFGQGAFFGIGVYTTATLVGKLGWGFLATLPLAGLSAIGLGLIVGFVVFRLRKLRGELFALLTLAVDFILASVARNSDFIDGGFGIPLGRLSYPEFLGDFTSMIYRLGLIIALSTVFSAYAIQHSRFGRGLFAIRDDETVAEGLGVPTFRYKMAIFGISCFFAGISGGLHAIQINYVTVEGIFSIRIPLSVILMTILGGPGHWFGPVIGATVIHTLNDSFSSAALDYLNQIVIGGLLIVMILFVREGIYERLKRRALPALAVIVGVMAIQLLTGSETRFINQAATAMLSMILLLLVPDRFYRRLTGIFSGPHVAVAPHPARTVKELRSNGPVVGSESGINPDPLEESERP